MSANVPPQMTLEALRSVPLFASLGDEAAEAVRELLEVKTVPAGRVLFREGDRGDALYLIEDGTVRIHVRDADGDEVTLAELSRGDFFGEMALLDGKPRSAQATTRTEARLAVLMREDFLSFVRGDPEVALNMLAAITTRLRHTDEMIRQRVSRNLNEVEEERMTTADRVADRMAEFGGSWKFIFLTLLVLAVWIPLNAWYWPPEARPDPWPFDMLALFLGVVAGLQVPIVLMSQNRQEMKDRLRADLDYQVNLKNELALAEVLRRLDVLESERLPLLFDEQSERMKKVVGRQ
jgi:CRP/FNR family transcriptional regulator, cyclic AMP receptor protein